MASPLRNRRDALGTSEPRVRKDAHGARCPPRDIDETKVDAACGQSRNARIACRDDIHRAVRVIGGGRTSPPE